MRAYSPQTADFLRFFRPVWSIETTQSVPQIVSRIGRDQSHDVLADYAEWPGFELRARFQAYRQFADRPYPSQHTQGELLMTRLIALLLIAGTAALAGCNTTAGAGQDISKAGNALTNSADKHGAE
jgi:predicted small secreted protein